MARDVLADAQHDASPSVDASPSANARRIVFTILSGKVREGLVDFPVYVDVTAPELQTQLALDQMSFKRRTGAAVEALPYEVESFEKAVGRLRAWVRLPMILSTADNVFELQYGDSSVASPPSPAEVWRNGYRAVFHLESATNPIVDSRGVFPGTAMNLQPMPSVAGRLGRSIAFDNNINSSIAFANPLIGTGPSTISAWVRPLTPLNKEALVVMGAGQPNQARYLYAQFNQNQVGVGMYENDWLNTGILLEEQTWVLLHWTYNNQVSRLYQDGVLINSFVHSTPANTQGTQAWLGNSKSAGFDNDSGLNGRLDEVYISNVERSAGWIAAEHSSQFSPTSFAIASSPQPTP